jgi:hypothetical protein
MKVIHFDGGAVPNPGTRAIGIIFLEDNLVLKEISRKLDGIGTNNEAEYVALIEGLKQAHELGWTDILFQGAMTETDCCLRNGSRILVHSAARTLGICTSKEGK